VSTENLWAVTGGILSRMVHVRRLLRHGEAPARPLVEAAALARLLEGVIPADEVAATAAAMGNVQREHSEEVGVGPGYALWSASYDTEPNPLIFLEEPATLALLGDVSGKDVLDAACGTGRYAVQLAQAGARVCGLDPSPEMLARARCKCDAAGTAVAWREGELYALPYADASFDAAVCALALCHVPDLRKAVAELARVLRPGGKLVLSDFHPYCLMLGWRTCFMQGGRWYLIRNELHQISDIVSALGASGMVLTDLREELVDDRLAPMLGDEVELFRDQPIALIVAARKGPRSRGVEESKSRNGRTVIPHRVIPSPPEADEGSR
jgi:SAM-dependent methyltransferase